MVMVEAPFTTVIERDERGRPWVRGTNTKVAEIVMDQIAWGWTPEKMHEEHPHLSMAQLHAALAYYYEHKDEIDGQIEESKREAERLRPVLEDPEFRERLIAFKQERLTKKP